MQRWLGESVRVVQLDPATLRALAAGELPLASPVGQQWDDEDGLETVYERPA